MSTQITPWSPCLLIYWRSLGRGWLLTVFLSKGIQFLYFDREPTWVSSRTVERPAAFPIQHFRTRIPNAVFLVHLGLTTVNSGELITLHGLNSFNQDLGWKRWTNQKLLSRSLCLAPAPWTWFFPPQGAREDTRVSDWEWLACFQSSTDKEGSDLRRLGSLCPQHSCNLFIHLELFLSIQSSECLLSWWKKLSPVAHTKSCQDKVGPIMEGIAWY